MKRVCADCLFLERPTPAHLPVCAHDDRVRGVDDEACERFMWTDARLAALERIEKRLLELREYRNGAAIMAMELLDLMSEK